MNRGQFVQLRRQLSTNLIAVLSTIFGGYSAWNDSEAGEFAAGAVPLVQGSQRTLAALTAYYVAASATEATGQLIVPAAVPDSAVLGLRGVAPSTVYQRPFVATRVALSKGDEQAVAVQRGATRLAQVAEGDMQQTYAHAARAAMTALPKDVDASGWRRVLNGDRNCALCVIASTRLYKVETLNPMHHQCDCSVEAVYGSHPGVGEEATAKVRAAISEVTDKRGAKELRRLIVEHGELGPMLVRPKDHFEGPHEALDPTSA